jgi:thiol-disulfide isomerase/thioredoxin
MKRRKKRRNSDNFIRNVLIVFGIVLSSLIAMVIFFNITSDDLKYKDFPKIGSYEEVNQIQDETYLLYFYSETCPYCNQIKNRSLNFFEEHKDDLPVYLLDADKIRGSKDSLNLPFGESLKSTPTLMIVQNGIIIDFLVGTIEITDYYDGFSQNSD